MKHTRTAFVLATALTLAALVRIPQGHADLVQTLGDLHYWGSGSNQSALVIHWNDGKSDHGLAWGFNWDGGFTVGDMLVSLAQSDPRLFIRIDSETPMDMALFGIGYRTGAADFGLVGAQDTEGNSVTPTFVMGVNDMNLDPETYDAPASSADVEPLNSGDRYSEAWSDFEEPHNRFWGFHLGGSDGTTAESSETFPLDWTYADSGISSISLTNQGWFALTFSNPDWESIDPASAIAAIPEPAGVFLMVFGGALFGLARRRRPR